jgi:Ca2+-binding EF-hand superfamily protein
MLDAVGAGRELVEHHLHPAQANAAAADDEPEPEQVSVSGGRGEADASRTTASSASDALSGWIMMQTGTSEWTKFWMEIKHSPPRHVVLEMRVDEGSAKPVVRVNPGQCEVRDPKSQRRGRPHCFRINVPLSQHKFIIDPISNQSRNEWLHVLSRRGAWLLLGNLPWASVRTVTDDAWMEGCELIDTPRHLLVNTFVRVEGHGFGEVLDFAKKNRLFSSPHVIRFKTTQEVEDVVLQKVDSPLGARFLVQRASLQTLQKIPGVSPAGRRRKMVVLYENNRCPWSISGPDDSNYSATHLRVTDRPQWSTLRGDKCWNPAEHKPWEGWDWEGQWVSLPWEYAAGWNESWQQAGEPGGVNCWVRRTRYERLIVEGNRERRTLVCYENERQGLNGPSFGKEHRLPEDYPAWSTKRGNPVQPPKSMLPKPGWIWHGDWEARDWTFSDTWTSSTWCQSPEDCARKGFVSLVEPRSASTCVRRRKWLREMSVLQDERLRPRQSQRQLLVKITRGRNLVSCNSSGLSDPYAVVRVGRSKKYKTAVAKKTASPEWNEGFGFGFGVPADITEMKNEASNVLRIELFGANFIGSDDPMGAVEIDLPLMLTTLVYRPTLRPAEISADSLMNLSAAALNTAVSQRMPNGLPAAFTADEDIVDDNTLPGVFFSETWFRLEGVSTGDIQVGLGLQDTHCETPPMDGKLDNVNQLFAELKLQCPPKSFSDDYGYAIPDYGRDEWFEHRGIGVCEEERAILRWRAHLKADPTFLNRDDVSPHQQPVRSTDAPYASPCKLVKNVADLVRGGVPGKLTCARHFYLEEDENLRLSQSQAQSQLRQNVWHALSGARDIQACTKISYEQICDCASQEEWLSLGQGQAGFRQGQAMADQIEKDLPRTAPSTLRPEEYVSLRRLLTSGVRRFPQPGYCQGMNFVALALLRALSSEEAAFWVMCGLCTRICPLYYVSSMTGTQVDMQVIETLARDFHAAQAVARCDEAGFPLQVKVSQWLLNLFVGTLPSITVFSLWDWLMVDGPDALVCVAVTLIKLLEPELLKVEEFMEVSQIFDTRTYSLGLYGVDILDKARQLLDTVGRGTLLAMRQKALAGVIVRSERHNRNVLVRNFHAETGLKEADIERLHEKFTTKRLRAAGSMMPAAAGVLGSARVASTTAWEERVIDYEGFKQLMHEEMPAWANADTTDIRRLFNAFDDDGSGYLNEQEFIYGLAAYCGDSVEEKIRLSFAAADVDDSGVISFDELTSLFESCYRIAPPEVSIHFAVLPQIVHGIFQRLNINQEDGLSFEQFRDAVYNEPLILRTFSTEVHHQEGPVCTPNTYLENDHPVRVGWLHITVDTTDGGVPARVYGICGHGSLLLFDNELAPTVTTLRRSRMPSSLSRTTSARLEPPPPPPQPWLSLALSLAMDVQLVEDASTALDVSEASPEGRRCVLLRGAVCDPVAFDSIQLRGESDADTEGWQKCISDSLR